MINKKKDWDWIIATDHKIISRHKTRLGASNNVFRKIKLFGPCGVHLISEWRQREAPVRAKIIGVDMEKVMRFMKRKECVDRFNTPEQLNIDLLRIASR
jgi:hypothetical protein